MSLHKHFINYIFNFRYFAGSKLSKFCNGASFVYSPDLIQNNPASFTLKSQWYTCRVSARFGCHRCDNNSSKDNPQIVNEKDLKEIAETFAEIKKAPVSLSGHYPDPTSSRLGNEISGSYDEKTHILTGEIEE
jgi:hypothetical protein